MKTIKTKFVHINKIYKLNKKENKFLLNINKIIHNKSNLEIIGYVDNKLSYDNKKRPLYLSIDIINKITLDHGNICFENMIINAHRWDLGLMYNYENIDKINLIKLIPESNNYILIAANRNNGFFIVTHFETVSKDNKNLKRLLGRGRVISRGPSVCL